MLVLILLFAVSWGRVWAGVPHITVHHHAQGDPGAAQHDACGIDIALAGLADHAHAHAPTLEAEAADEVDGDGQHPHHVHLCSFGASALMTDTGVVFPEHKPALHALPVAGHAIRRNEPLLRPPQT